jgi:hypothetical protein
MSYEFWAQELSDRKDRVGNENLDGNASLIEIGLSDGEYQDLQGVVRAVLATRRMRAGLGAWPSPRAPLLMLATEIAYRYGDGARQYWPSLEQVLGREIEVGERQVLVDLFRGYGCPPPPDVPWSNQFSLIAWPISEAICPRWLHGSLLTMLQRCPVLIEPNNRSEYLGWMMSQVASHPSLSLLINQQRMELASSVVEALLDVAPADMGGGRRLSKSFVDRLKRDVHAEVSTRALMRQARSVQTELRTHAWTALGLNSLSVPTVQLRVDLILDLSRLQLRTAPINHPILNPSNLGVAMVRVAGQRFSCSAVELTMRGVSLPSLPHSNTPGKLLEHVQASVTAQVKGILEGLTVERWRLPLVFSSRLGGAGFARQVVQLPLAKGYVWHVLNDVPMPNVDGVSVMGRVAGSWLHEVDTGFPTAVTALQGIGLNCSVQAVATLFGSPSIGGPGSGVFRRGDAVLLSVAGGSTTLKCDGEGDQVLGRGYYQLHPELSIMGRLASSERNSGAALLIERQSSEFDMRMSVRVALSESSVETVEALRARLIEVEVRTPVGAVGLRVRLSLLDETMRVLAHGWTQQLPALPASVSPTDPAWSALSRQVEGYPEEKPLLLQVEVPALGRALFVLRGRETTEFESPEVAEFDTTPEMLDWRWWRAEEPWVGYHQQLPGVGLYAPTSFNHPGEVRGPPSMSLLQLQVGRSPPPLLLAEQEVVEHARSLVRWTRARPIGAPAGFVRHGVVSGLHRDLLVRLCGETWAHLEANEETHGERWQEVAQRLLTVGAAFHLGEEEKIDKETMARALSTLTERLRLQGTTLLMSGIPDANCWESRSRVVGEWLDECLTGLGVDADPPCNPGVVKRAFEPATRINSRPFSRLAAAIFPTTAGSIALGLCASDAPRAKLLDGLMRLRSSFPSPNPWSREGFEQMFAFWLGQNTPEALEATMRVAVRDVRGCRLTRLAALHRGVRPLARGVL